MAISHAAVGATDLALAADDKPMMLHNAGYAPTATEWSADLDFAGSDIVATGYPIVRAYDGKVHLATRPNAGATSQFLLFDFGSGTEIEFDAIAIMGYGTTLAGQTLSFYIDDSNDDFSNATYGSGNPIGTITPASDGARKMNITLFHTGSTALRYTGVRYVGIGSTGGGSHTPDIGEVLFLRRHQLKKAPQIPWDDYSQTSKVRDFESDNGVISRNTRAAGRFDLSARFTPWETAYVSDAQAWWEGIGYGARPFVWCYQPNTDPDAFHYMFCRPEMKMPYVGPFERPWTLSAREQGPDGFYLSQESA